MNREKVFSYYLLAISLLGSSFAFIVTYRYGAGLATDGARYLSTAENLINGNGFTEYLGVPLTQFPPVYSIIIAIIGFITRTDVFVIAQYLNVITFGLTIWLAGRFFRKLFPENFLYAYMGSGIFVTSLSLLRMASNILSDLMFLALTLVFLMVVTDFIETPSRKNLLTLGLLCATSPLLRYAGLTHILTVSLIILILNRREWIKGILQGGLFGLLTSLPTMLWVFFHSYLQTGILFGARLPPNPQGNLETTVEKAVHWFVPYSVTDRIPEWIIISFILVILITGNRLEHWKKWGKKLTSPGFLPNVVFLLFYISVLIFNVSYSEVRWPFMDRIHIIILPSLMAVGFLTIRELLPFYLRGLSLRSLHTTAAIIFILWLAYPLNGIQETLRNAYINGETSEYNIYNTRAQNESGVREFVESLSISQTEKVYSNYEPLAWLYARHTILKLPQGPVSPETPNPDEVLKNYPDWPGSDGAGYVIWMKQLGFKEYVLSPDQLTSKADFELLFSSKQGDVYRITPK
ncbi:MAG TPA: hypothetical protein VJ972_05050 [Anaerolineales bacterium]|nr:hypothetical protein [Anaerolineales bacterium]